MKNIATMRDCIYIIQTFMETLINNAKNNQKLSKLMGTYLSPRLNPKRNSSFITKECKGRILLVHARFLCTDSLHLINLISETVDGNILE